MTLLGKIPNIGWEILNFDESIECKFSEDTYDGILCMKSIDVCLEYCRGIMQIQGLQMVLSVIGLESFGKV